MELYNFDDRNIHWNRLGDFEHLVYSVLNIDEKNKIVNVLFKFAAKQQIALHRHMAQNSTLVIQGEHLMQRIVMGALACLIFCNALVHAQPTDNSAIAVQSAESDLSYKSYIHSTKRMKCLYGYAADKTGDHAAAIEIFEDCIARWNDVYSMIWLAQIYESGVGIKQDFEKSTALLKRGAHVHDESTYSSLARYHYGVALAEGRGTLKNRTEAEMWLKKAADEGVNDAADFLKNLSARSE